MQKIFFLLTMIVLYILPVDAQQYKLKQSTGMMGMKNESTIYVKGMRKRTESNGSMGMPAPPVEILQCDLQRTVKLNDKKKLYFIAPFRQEAETNEAAMKAAKSAVQTAKQTRKGGIIYNYYAITDSGERKKIFGFTARHLWTTRRMVPSADACMMKDSMLIKTDGWYIDFPDFNCPVNAYGGYMNGGKSDCIDRFVTKQTGKGKLGFPLTETTTMIMGGQQGSFTTTLETLELSTAKLDSMLFEIPPGYTQTMNEEDLEEKISMDEMMKKYGASSGGTDYSAVTAATNGPKPAGTIRIGVLPAENGNELSVTELQQHLAAALIKEGIQGVTITDKADAQSKECDFMLSTRFTRIKQGSKLGGLLKAVKNADPGASATFTIDIEYILTRTMDGHTVAEPRSSGKYEGKINEAARKALDDGAGQILKEVTR
jgi:hypothetical protein